MSFVFKLGGLTLALLGFLVITVYVSYQLSFDTYHDNYKSIYRVNSIRDEDGRLEKYSTVPPAIGPALKEEIPEVKSFARVGYGGNMLVKYNEKILRIGGFTHADSSLFDVLTFRFIRGTTDCIHRPGTIALSSSVATQIFGEEDPVGKMILFPEKNNRTLEVTAVVEDLPVNTLMGMNAVMPFNAFDNSDSMNYDWEITWDGSIFLYVRLHEQANRDLFYQKMQEVVKRNIAEHDDGREKRFSLFLQRIDEIYLKPGLKMEFLKKGSAFYVYVFSLLGIFLLVIASINYINLSIADLHNRSKEIGIRKILGARKKQIAVQIAIEALIYCLVSLVLSVVILYIIFPQVARLLEPNLDFSMLLNPMIILIVGVTVLFIVTSSTTYSLIKLSINNAITDLKKELIFGSELSMGKFLLLIQFVISYCCIAVTIIVSNQVSFVVTKDLGFDRTNVVTLVMPDEYPPEKARVLKNELKALAGVQDVSYSYYLVTGIPYLKDWYNIEIGNSMKQIQLNEIFVDHEFFKTMDIEILAGRGFDAANPGDFRTAFIVNETAAREFGWQDPIGKRISYGYGETEGEKWEGTVVGLVRDFNTRSLHETIEPLVIRLPFDDFPGMSLNVKVKGDIKEALADMQSTYAKVLPGYLMDYMLVDEVYEDQYREEKKALSALELGTWVVLLISAFGIFSLSVFMSMKRMKEFGIRKVLGATVRQIAFLHIGYFVRIAVVGSAIALPISYWMTKQWLNGFAYRAEPGLVVFLKVALILLLMVIFTGAYSTLKAGKMNPVDAIKL